ncbi:MAG TPA: competence/damage-inducible protein A [Mariniphaga sp.]|nr:competence/damage-inducible protein A [Mariniphaga sp.]
MKAEIITIGDEILIGQIVDTNSAWIAEQLNLAGVEVFRITSVHDDLNQIEEALKQAEKDVDFVLITGGLGPTKDDITKTALCNFFNTRLIFNEDVFNIIHERFTRRNIDINKLNRDQALVPELCEVIPNKLGTAPGLWFEKNNTIFVSVPGVPFEMRHILTYEILPRLMQTGRTKAIYHKTIHTQGLPESMLAERIDQWETALPADIKLAYLPNPMSVRLRLSAVGDNEELLKQRVEKEAAKLQDLIPDYIFGYDEDTLPEVIGRMLIENGRLLAVAESCTGGYISHLITLVPGSSGYYKGGLTAYSNELKENLLGVDPELITRNGAVSEPVVRQMAEGLKNLMKVDYTISTSGIAGPDGGTDEKPVGTVWIAVAGPYYTAAEKFILGDNRERNIIRSSYTALRLLRQMILKDI